jgi:hypothetical protein
MYSQILNVSPSMFNKITCFNVLHIIIIFNTYNVIRREFRIYKGWRIGFRHKCK